MLRGRGHAEKGGAAAGASVNTVAVQRNWAERDFVQGVQVGVAQLTAFLNDFGARARAQVQFKLADSGFIASTAASQFVDWLAASVYSPTPLTLHPLST